MYDYTVEMMKKYPRESEYQYFEEIDFGIIAEGLCIVCGGERISVDKKVKDSFKKKYKKYVTAKLNKLGDRYVILMLQGTYHRIVPRNTPRNGMEYIEDNLKPVIDSLPKLEQGQRYVFPALRIIKAEYGTDFLVFPR